MKVARFFAAIFAVLGIVLMLGTTVVCFATRNTPVQMLETPDGALLCSEELQQQINAGDFSAAGQLIYGQPAFGTERTPGDVYATILWDAFRDSISFSYTSRLYLLDSELARDGVITVLNVPALLESMGTRVAALMEQKINAVQDQSELYDEDGNIRREVVEQVLQEALRQSLEKDASYITRNVTIKLIRRDERWWALPDQTFLNTISGLEA